MKILLIEDDRDTRQFLTATLTNYRYTVDSATDGQTGLELAKQGQYDAILLDVIVPELDGIEVCRALRQEGDQTPILMLTAKATDEDVVKGLDAGADDYVTKPCDSAQLLARVRALVRRKGDAKSRPVLTWGALQLDPIAIRVTYRNQQVSLSPKEYKLLELFLRHPQRIFSRSSIIDHLWSIDDTPTDAAVTNLIKDLRHSLKTAGLGQEIIETVYRMGYRLNPPPSNCLPLDQEQEQELAIAPTLNSTQTFQEGITLIDDLRKNFQASLKERLVVLEQVGRSLTNGREAPFLNTEQREQARAEAHRLAGGLGTFGYQRGSELARSLEHLLKGESKLDGAIARKIVQLVQELRQAIDHSPEVGSSALPLPVAPPRLIRPTIRPVPLEIGPTTSNNSAMATAGVGGSAPSPALPAPPYRVLLIDADAAFITQLRAIETIHRLDIIPLSSYKTALAWLDETREQHQPDLILMNVQLEAPWEANSVHGETQGSVATALASPDNRIESCIRTLKVRCPATPILALAERDVLKDRVAVSNGGGDRYLLKSEPVESLIHTLLGAIAGSTSPEPKPLPQSTARVMIVDDDPVSLKALMVLLQPWGLQVTCLNHPARFWNVLTATCPDVLLLDVEMPSFNGLELCRVVRQDPKYEDLPILIVTAHTDPATIHAVFAAGADDIVFKPIAGPDLITRLMGQVERAHMQKQLLTLQQKQAQQAAVVPLQDDAHHLRTWREVAPQLQQELRQLAQAGDSLSLIRGCVDPVRGMENPHDPAQPEATLPALDAIVPALRSCLEFSGDRLFRWGENEFVLLLPQTDLAIALQMADRIQRAIGQAFAPTSEAQAEATTAPAPTLSLGITGTFPNAETTLQDLIAIAGGALYAAMARGGNTYCLHLS